MPYSVIYLLANSILPVTRMLIACTIVFPLLYNITKSRQAVAHIGKAYTSTPFITYVYMCICYLENKHKTVKAI